jgi:hypothetical protein
MNRRDLLRNLGLGAAALVPVGAVAVAEKKKRSDVVAPLLMERVCDGGEAECDPKDWADWQAQRRASGITWNNWCGTRFQWYWGSQCCCPNCDTCYCIQRKDKEKYIAKA